MKVVITSATEKEILQVKQTMDPLFTGGSKRFSVLFSQSGVGLLASCFSISKMIFEERPDLVIQVGIAGTFDEKMPLSKVVAVNEDVLGDCGVEEAGTFKDLFDLKLQGENTFPFSQRKLINRDIQKWNILQLDEVKGVTVNEISARTDRITQLRLKYDCDIESMEGAALHYCCLQTATPFIQIRAISNYIGERDKLKWKFTESFDNLATIVTRYIEQLYKVK